jgi:hypothetical protein
MNIHTYSDLLNIYTTAFQSSIPRYIFRTGAQKLSDLPEEIMAFMVEDMANNPSYTIFYFDDEDCRRLIRDMGDAELVETYEGIIPSAFKADLWRYVVLYCFGGIYLDLTHKAVVPYNDIVSGHTELFLKDKREDIGLNNSFLACCKGNPVLREAINLCKINYFNRASNLNIFDYTGPKLLERAFCKVYGIEFSYGHSVPLGTQSLRLVIVEYNPQNVDIDLWVHNERGEPVIQYRASKNHYALLYQEGRSVAHYSVLCGKNLVYEDERWKAIKDLYLTHLLRYPDIGGMCNYYFSGFSIEFIEQSILDSAEYANLHEGLF